MVAGADWSVAALLDKQAAAETCYARRARERRGGCVCRDCCSVDKLPGSRLREVSPLAEFIGRRLEVCEGVTE